MKKVLPILMLAFSLVFVQQSFAGIIDWDRKMGLRRVEGTVVSVDRRSHQVTVKNSVSGKDVTYNATEDLISDVSEGDRILLKHKQDTKTVHSIEKK